MPRDSGSPAQSSQRPVENCSEEDSGEPSLTGLVLSPGAADARYGEGLGAALAKQSLLKQQLRTPSLTDLMQAGAEPLPTDSPADGAAAAEAKGLRTLVASLEDRCERQDDSEKHLKRELHRLQGELSHVKKDRDMMYFAWHKAKAENQALSTQLSDLKAQQHKTAMKANNKANILQCKIDSLVYLSQEAEKKHRAELAELRAKLETVMDVSGGSQASGATALPISV